MLYIISVFRPHSSPDPFGATLPPGEGIISPLQILPVGRISLTPG